MIRFLCDEHIPKALIQALHVRNIEVVRVHDVGLVSTEDHLILDWAATEHWVLVTFDRNTMPAFAYDRVDAGEPMPGVIVIDETLSLAAILEELHIVAACGRWEDFRDQVVYIPLAK